MKNLVREFVLVGMIVSAAAAAKVTKEKIETKIIELPQVSVQKINYKGLSVSYAVSDIVLGDVTKLTADALCTPKDKLDPTKLPTEYYALSYEKPGIVIVAKDPSGTVVFADELKSGEVVNTAYGKGECRFWFPGVLEKTWAEEKESFRRSLQEKELKETATSVEETIRNALFARYAAEEFNLYSADNADGKYNDLAEAFSIAQKAYVAYKTVGYSPALAADLKKAIVIWQKALEESDLSDKKARINYETTLKLHENVAVAAMFSNDYDLSIAQFNKIKGLERSVTTTSVASHYSQIKLRAQHRYTGLARNPGVLESEPLVKKALADADSYRSQVKITAQQNSYAALKKEFDTYALGAYKEMGAFEKQSAANAAASGQANLYDGQVVYSAMQGYAFMKTPLMAMGEKFAGVPVELCAIERLNQLIITNNQVATVPPEIGALKNLKVLNLKSNKIAQLPEEIGSLSKIESIDLSDNQLTKLPESIGKLTTLTKLTLKGNPLPAEEMTRIQAALPNCKVKF